MSRLNDDVIKCEKCGEKSEFVTIVSTEEGEDRIGMEAPFLQQDAIRRHTEEAFNNEETEIEIGVERLDPNGKNLKTTKIKCNNCGNIEKDVLPAQWDENNNTVSIKDIKDSNRFTVIDEEFLKRLRRLIEP